MVAPEAVAAAAAKTDVALPDVPGHMVTCINRAHVAPADRKDGAKVIKATANDRVVALKKTAEDRQRCGQALVGWYRSIQAANKKAAETPAKKGG